MSKFTYHRDSPQNSVSKPIYAPGPPNKTEARRSHPLGRRIVARLLDFILQGLLFVFVALVLNGTIFPARSFSDDSGLSLLALILTYFLSFELLIRTPPGKSLVGLEVTELDGSRPGNLSIVYRNVARLVDEVIFTPLLGIAFVIFKAIEGGLEISSPKRLSGAKTQLLMTIRTQRNSQSIQILPMSASLNLDQMQGGGCWQRFFSLSPAQR